MGLDARGGAGGSRETGSKNERAERACPLPPWLPMPDPQTPAGSCGRTSVSGAVAPSSPGSLVHFPFQGVFLAGYKQLPKAPMPH